MALEHVHVYPVDQRPDVLVEVDGQWCTAEARMRTRYDDGRLIYNCSWRLRTGASARIDNFPAERVRLDEREWGPGGVTERGDE